MTFPPAFDLFLIFVFTILPLIAALVCLRAMVIFIKKARMSEDTPVSKIRSAAQGYVEIRGRIKNLPNQNMKGRLTGYPCVWFHSVIEEFKTYQTDQGLITRLEPVEDKKTLDPFLVSDEHGECLVFPKEAEIFTPHFSRWYGATRYPKPLTKKRSWWFWIWGEQKRYQYTEFYLQDSDVISVAGNFQTIPKATIQNNQTTNLNDYLKKNESNTIDIISNHNLPQSNAYIISAIPKSSLSKKLRMQAFIACLAFLFFISLTLISTYPLVVINLYDWLKSQENFHSMR